MSASITVALSRLITHGLSHGVILPILLAIVIADRGTALAMRWRAHLVLAIVIGAVLSVVALVIGVDPSVFAVSSPHFVNLTYLSGQLHAAQHALANDGTPLPHLGGVVIAIGGLGSLAAAASRGIWEHGRGDNEAGRIGSLMPCLAPSFGVFIYSTLVSANQDRVAAAAIYFAGVLLFMALADRTSNVVVPPATRRRFRLQLSTIAGCGLVLALLLGVGAGLSGMRLSVFHVTPPTQQPRHNGGAGTEVAPDQSLTGTSLLDDLRTVLIKKSDEVIFHATSPLPTYWQVGTLSTFDGTEWLPTSGVNAALGGDASATAASLEPASLPIPSGGQAFTASVDISDFVSRLLPSPPHTLGVTGLSAQAVGDEGVLAAVPSAAGTSYAVTAHLNPMTVAGGSQLSSSDPRLAPYLALPNEPAIVSFLAHEVVLNAPTQGDQAQALVNWFHSGRFRYTLSPPATTGPNPLVQFLTVTHAGYCQQFAGAFGVMARTLGIPTRLVVGFIAGQKGSGNTYTITGADAHVWPQVYLGPGTGWVSVEPTPPAATNTATPAGVVGPASPPKGTSTQTTVAPTGGRPTGTTPSNTPGTAGTKKHHRGAGTQGRSSALWLILLLIALVAAAGGAVWWFRNRRSADDIALPPNQRIVRAWERAHLALRRQGLGRRVAETPGEYVARLGAIEQRTTQPVGADLMARLAALVELACYTPRPCSAAQADTAQGWAATIVGANRRRRTAAAPSGVVR